MTNEEQHTKVQMARLETSLTYVSQCLEELKKTMKDSTDLLHKIDKSTDAIPILEGRISRAENEIEELKSMLWKAGVKIALLVGVLSSGGTWLADKIF